MNSAKSEPAQLRKGRTIGMEVISELVNKAKTVTTFVGKKAGEVLDVSKLKFSSAQLQGDIRRSFEHLGELVYHSHASGRDVQPVIQQCIADIQKQIEELGVLDEKIQSCQHKKVCPQCGAPVGTQQAYCAKCGMQQEAEAHFESKAEQPADCGTQAQEEEMAVFTEPLDTFLDR